MRIFHVNRPDEPYHRGNSLRGIRRAARNGWPAIDLDLQMTRDGVVVNTHWDRPMLRDGFRDPWRQIPKEKRVRNMTWNQVSRLVAGRLPRRYKIHRVERVLKACARRGIIAFVEPKGDPRFEDPAVWRYVAAVADDVGCDLRGRSIRNLGGFGAGVRRVKAMRAAGIPANVIY